MSDYKRKQRFSNTTLSLHTLEVFAMAQIGLFIENAGMHVGKSISKSKN